IVERHAGETMRVAALEPLLERRATLEVALVHLHREAEARLERVVLDVDVLVPESIALLETHGVEGARARGEDPVVAAGLPEEAPRSIAHRSLAVELPAELAGVRDPLRPHRRDLADVQIPRRHVRESVVRDVVVRNRLQDVARPRAPEAEREQ